jgi:hypothetical protein
LSQNFFTALFYLAAQNKAPAKWARAEFSDFRANPQIRGNISSSKPRALWERRVLRVFAAEALDAAGGIHQLLLAGEEGWQAEQISTLISPLWVDRVTKALPHAQCTRTSL